MKQSTKPQMQAAESDPDRLSAAMNFSHQLSESRLREMAEAYRRRWTPAARAAKAQLIQRHRPWTRSTGPRGLHRTPADRAMIRALRDQSVFLMRLNRAIRARDLGFPASGPLFAAVHAEGRAVTARLLALMALMRAVADSVITSKTSSVTGRNNE